MADFATVTATTALDIACHAAQVGESGECDYVTYVQNITGGAGDDTLTGNDKSNVIKGGAGDDTIAGGTDGYDALYGDMGDDGIDNSLNVGIGSVLSGGTGTNTMTGGAGNNTLDNSQGGADSVLDCGTGDAEVVLLSGLEDLGNVTNCQIQL